MEPIKYENRLKQCRINARLKQSQVVELLGLASANRLSRWEAGLAEPNLKNLLQLSRIYDVDVEHLYPIDDGRPPRMEYIKECTCGGSDARYKFRRVIERRDGSLDILSDSSLNRITSPRRALVTEHDTLEVTTSRDRE